MTVLQVRTYGDPCLEQVSEPVGPVADLAELVRDMLETMYEENGIGLAAPQIGSNIRLFVTDVDYVDGPDGKPGKRNPKVWINPEITWESVEDDVIAEGCLSVPGIQEEVYRPVSIRVRYRDRQGREREALLEGMEARCFQHELDHLNGVLFIDRMAPLRRRFLAGKLRRVKQGVASG